MNKHSKIMPPTYFLMCLVVAILISFLFPFAKVINDSYVYIGIPIIIGGIILEFWADTLFKKRKTTVQPFKKSSALVTEGPFRISRNPMYLGFVLILLGLTILFGNILVIFVPIALIVTFELIFIPDEERLLEETFKDEYLRYKKQVRKWL